MSLMRLQSPWGLGMMRSKILSAVWLMMGRVIRVSVFRAKSWLMSIWFLSGLGQLNRPQYVLLFWQVMVAILYRRHLLG